MTTTLRRRGQRSLVSVITQLVLGFTLPWVIATVWVLIAMKGFSMFGNPTPEQLAWQNAGFVVAIAGYAGLAAVCVLLSARWRIFALTAGITGGLLAFVQLLDLTTKFI